ncbi:MAG: rRNA adenine methyltransferase [Anaerolineae bacterium]|nr:rRNA adenine methyltransferase [Anaerolineae bacterium]
MTLTDQSRDWEALWAPYDEPTYAAVLQAIQPDDVVLDIGAGDLRLARCMAAKAKQVVAWEIQTALLADNCVDLPDNLAVYRTDARFEAVPNGVTAAVLLMRHCTHFGLYVKKLRTAGCQRLLTNARWGMDVEVVDLQQPRLLYTALPMGWFACWCGHTGFKAGPAEQLTWEKETAVTEVAYCPNCRYNEP